MTIQITVEKIDDTLVAKVPVIIRDSFGNQTTQFKKMRFPNEDAVDQQIAMLQKEIANFNTRKQAELAQLQAIKSAIPVE